MALLTKSLRRVGLIVKPNQNKLIILVPKKYVKNATRRNYIRRFIKCQLNFMSVSRKLTILVIKDIENKPLIFYLLSAYCKLLTQSFNSSSFK